MKLPKPIARPDRPANVPPELKIEPPTAVGNDYRDRIRHARSGPMPSEPISVVIPVYNRRVMLGRTLACLLHQTYPLDLIEVVVADDGSSDRPDEVLDTFSNRFGAVKYVRQDDDGYRLAEVRNLGVRSATHDNVIILDCDMAPVPRLVELFARHLVTFPNALYCGHRRYVDANAVTVDSARRSINPMLALHDIETANTQAGRDEASRTTDWRLPIYAATGDVRFEKYPFRVVCGGNIAFTKGLFDVAGGFDEDFTDWGAEDAEWGFRVWNRGFYIVPVVDACGLHQEPPGGRNETDREAGRTNTTPVLVDRCPVLYRKSGNAGGHTVPLVSIYVPAYNAEDTIVTAVQSALDQTVRDLEVCVVNDGSTDRTLEVLHDHFSGVPQVRIGDQPNGGIGSASNHAVRMCRGAFIGQLDADDELRPDAVELMLAPMLRDTRIGVSYGSHVKIDGDGKTIGKGWVAPKYCRFRLMHSMIVHHFRLFRARDWYRTDGFAEDIRNAVDYDMFLKMAEVTEMIHVDERVYRYRIHDQSTSRKHRATQYRNHAVVVARALERRGLANDWQLESLDAADPRKYRFVRTPDPQRTRLPTGRVRVSGDGPDLVDRVSALYPNWTVENTEDPSHIDMLSPELSKGRARTCADLVRSSLPDTQVVVETTT
ncbi:putative glycosaminoglycan synthase [Ilumatobacter coccineus YM16-304]|uniref:Putative glycosaminoglycan synthase n=1 Tax=Ilumatobacter coccineus (strain NBRC 103263 / KCTC 29153 / YM16-304) TaxID=1313172 RepID=A0A6C7EE20_ILUCY|nr:putative glycosaminoglycan synthase [Ilumatobacter coccineus YM16-304]